MPLCAPKISHGAAWDRTRAFAVSGWRLTASWSSHCSWQWHWCTATVTCVQRKPDKLKPPVFTSSGKGVYTKRDFIWDKSSKEINVVLKVFEWYDAFTWIVWLFNNLTSAADTNCLAFWLHRPSDRSHRVHASKLRVHSMQLCSLCTSSHHSWCRGHTLVLLVLHLCRPPPSQS